MNLQPALKARPWRSKFTAGLFLLAAAWPLASLGETPAAPPMLEAQRLDGSPYSLGDGRGLITVIVFWSPDSLASRKSLGELQRFAAAHPPPEVELIAVSTQGDIKQIKYFASERQLSLPLALLGKTSLGPFPEQTLPHIHVFDRNGQLQASHRGLFRLRTLEEMIAPLR